MIVNIMGPLTPLSTGRGGHSVGATPAASAG